MSWSEWLPLVGGGAGGTLLGGFFMRRKTQAETQKTKAEAESVSVTATVTALEAVSKRLATVEGRVQVLEDDLEVERQHFAVAVAFIRKLLRLFDQRFPGEPSPQVPDELKGKVDP